MPWRFILDPCVISANAQLDVVPFTAGTNIKIVPDGENFDACHKFALK